MKILFVTEKFPYPLDTGGNVRTFHLMKGLAKEHELTLLATTQGEVQDAHLREVGKLCAKITLVRVEPNGLLRDLWMFARSLASPTPFMLWRHFYQAVQWEIVAAFPGGALRETAGLSNPQARRTFDVVHFNHLDAAMYARTVPKDVIQVLDEHNVVANQVRTTLATEDRLGRKLILRYEHAKLRDYEAQTCSRMNQCLVCSENDAQALAKMGVRTTAVIPNGVDLNYFVPVAMENRSERDIVFVGTLDYDPCEKGVLYFVNNIFPLIRRELPDMRFVVVGKNPSRRLQAIAETDKGVIFTGLVEDIRPYVQKAGVFVVPLLSGSGTRLKILEAMAMGVPIVTTSIGVQGIAAISGESLWIADSPVTFANAVLRTLRDLQGAEAMAKRARALVEQAYGWEAVTRLLLEEYRRLAVR
jgi:polysaccharide biosynthesis protein PslH